MAETAPDPIRVLHVDADSRFGARTAERLTHTTDRFTVKRASSAAEALDRLEDTTVDCILAAYALPDRNGIELLETIREDDPNLPFIFYTGQGSEDIASAAISAGVTDYLKKDTATEQDGLLAGKIRTAVTEYRSTQDLQARAAGMAAAIDGMAILDEDERFRFVNQAMPIFTATTTRRPSSAKRGECATVGTNSNGSRKRSCQRCAKPAVGGVKPSARERTGAPFHRNSR
jgi:CheY-like chemotaxis protein